MFIVQQKLFFFPLLPTVTFFELFKISFEGSNYRKSTVNVIKEEV